MAQLTRAQGQADLSQGSADKMYGFFKSSLSRLAVMLPQYIMSLDVPGGVLKPGVIVSIRYTIDGSPPMAAKVKVESVDDARKTICFDFVEGDVMKFYKSFKGSLEFGSGFAKCTMEADKKTSSSPSVDAYLHFAIAICKGVNDHLA